MPVTDDEVARRVDSLWPDPREREAVRASLGAYGLEGYEREAPRVRLAILALSKGEAAKVPELVAIAKRDYRDVLMWAEYPEEGQALWSLKPGLTDDEKQRLAEMRARDAEQHSRWRKG